MFLEKLSDLKKWLQVKHLAMSQEVPGMPGVTSEDNSREFNLEEIKTCTVFIKRFEILISLNIPLKAFSKTLLRSTF